VNNKKTSLSTYYLSSEVIEAIKSIADVLHMSEEEAVIYLLSLALEILESQEQSESKTPPPD
jgi:hypothetical protein